MEKHQQGGDTEMVLPNLMKPSEKSGSRSSLYNRGGLFLCVLCLLLLGGCASAPVGRLMETTAYCGCSACCGWERGSSTWLHLDFWNRYVNYGTAAGRPYTGQTASGAYPREPQEGLFSMDSLHRPYMIPVRTFLFPWYLMPKDGTIAADTRFYPFGTRMYVPGYGWGRVEDRGGAIKGKDRIDLFFESHQDALYWGRRKVPVQIYYP
jgi:3D domain